MRLFAAMLIAVFLLGAPGGQAVQAQPQICGRTYKVLPGDTLYSIAEKCRVSYLVLMSINVEMRDPNTIYPGQIIRLEAEAPLEFFEQPATGPAQDAGLQPGGTYEVRPGESLALIAYRYATTVAELIRSNPQLNNSPLIIPGQVLLMPADASRKKGWLGLSTLTPRSGVEIQVRLADYTPYAKVAFLLGIHDREDSFDNLVVEASTDALGEARVTMRVPFYARRGELWEVRLVHLEDSDVAPLVSPTIRIN